MNDGGQMAVSPHGSDIVFCVGNVLDSAYFLGVSHTFDGGTNWEHDTLPMGSRGWAVAFDPTDSNRVYVGGDSASSYPCLLITTDCGTTWTQSRTGLAGKVNVLVVDPGDGRVIYAGSNSGVFKSTDAGATWAATPLTQQTRTIVIDANNPENIYAGTYGSGVYASTDEGETWTQMNTGLTNAKVLSLAIRPGTENTLFAGTEGGAVFRTTIPTAVSARPRLDVRNATLLISPNPCYSATTVRFSSSLPAHSTLALYDASGRLLSTSPFRTSPFELRTSELAPGAYFIRVNAGRTTHTARVMVLD